MSRSPVAIVVLALVASLVLPSMASASDSVTVVLPRFDEQENEAQASTLDTTLSIFYTGFERAPDTVVNLYLYDERDGGLLRGDNEDLGFSEICNPCTFTVGSSGIANEFDPDAQLDSLFVRRRDVPLEALIARNNGDQFYEDRVFLHLSAVVEIDGVEAEQVFVSGATTIYGDGPADYTALMLDQFRFDDHDVEQQFADLQDALADVGDSVADVDDSVADVDDSMADLQETIAENYDELRADHGLLEEDHNLIHDLVIDVLDALDNL